MSGRSVPMAIENERKNEDLYLGSVHHIHNDRDKSDTLKREEA